MNSASKRPITGFRCPVCKEPLHQLRCKCGWNRMNPRMFGILAKPR